MNTQETAAFISFALYWAWVFSVVMGSAVLGEIPPEASQAIRLAGVCGIAAGLASLYRLIDVASGIDSRAYAASVAVFPVLLCALLGLAPARGSMLAVTVAVSFLSGAATSLLLCALGSGLSQKPRKTAIAIAGAASSAGALMAAGVNALPQTAGLICAAASLPASIVTFRIARLMPTPETAEDRTQSRSDLKPYRPLLHFMAAMGVVFGLVVEAGFESQGNAAGVSFLLSIAIPGIIVLVLLLATGKRVDLESLQHALLAFAIAGLTVTSIATGAFRTAGLFAVAITFGMFDIAAIISLLEIIRENEMPQLSTFALGRLYSEAGIAAGWAAGLALGAAGLDVVRVCTELGLGIVAAVALHEAALRKSVPDPTPTPLQESSGIPGDFNLAVSAIATELELSPRESEVFGMLAQGRTPKRISEMLFVSESTAKSHAYRIYRKADVHSQQELLDLVEARVRERNAARWKVMP